MSTKVSLVKEKSSVTVKYDGKAAIAFTLNSKNSSVTLKDNEVAMCKNNLVALANAGSIEIEGGVIVKGGEGSKSDPRTKDQSPVVTKDDDEGNDGDSGDGSTEHLDILDGSLGELADSLNELLENGTLTKEDIIALRKAEGDGKTRTGALELLDDALNEITETE
jgi:hypothetical protein